MSNDLACSRTAEIPSLVFSQLLRIIDLIFRHHILFDWNKSRRNALVVLVGLALDI
jgi:hypothetical protein